MTTEFAGAKARLETAAGPIDTYRLGRLAEQGVGDPARLPRTVKIMLENLLRRVGTRDVSDDDVRDLAGWPERAPGAAVAFMPSANACLTSDCRSSRRRDRAVPQARERSSR